MAEKPPYFFQQEWFETGGLAVSQREEKAQKRSAAAPGARCAMGVTLVCVVMAGFSCAVQGPMGETGARDVSPRLPRKVVTESLELARRHLMRSQTSDGNFRYEYDFSTGETLPSDNQVRQAGALWALALLHADRPTPQSRRILSRGLSFFRRHSRTTSEGLRYIVYPGARAGTTGTVALVSLSLVEVIETDWGSDWAAGLREELWEYVGFLRSLRTDDGRFQGRYSLEDGSGLGAPSPYSDGEALLLLTRVAQLLDREDLRDVALESAKSMHRTYVQEALVNQADIPTAKQFYQWGCLAYYEICSAGWPGARKWAGITVQMGEWMIDVHRTLWRRKNTAYAHEGMAIAWELARRTERTKARRKIGHIHDLGLRKLISWQVGGPLPNSYLQSLEEVPDQAVGGVMNSRANPVLRIDVTQHFAHALLLTRRFMYNGEKSNEE
jgi:UDP-N-acetylmuramoyl-tripeptide--D-alanyl-D-alanine ligase